MPHKGPACTDLLAAVWISFLTMLSSGGEIHLRKDCAQTKPQWFSSQTKKFPLKGFIYFVSFPRVSCFSSELCSLTQSGCAETSSANVSLTDQYLGNRKPSKGHLADSLRPQNLVTSRVKDTANEKCPMKEKDDISVAFGFQGLRSRLKCQKSRFCFASLCCSNFSRVTVLFLSWNQI